MGKCEFWFFGFFLDLVILGLFFYNFCGISFKIIILEVLILCSIFLFIGFLLVL